MTLYKLLFLRDLLPPGEEKLGILNFDAATRLTDQARAPPRATAPARRAVQGV